QEVSDGTDVQAIERAIQAAIDVTDRPSLITVQTVIGFGSPDKQGTFEAHGSPLGAAEVVKTKQALGWPTEPAFYIPDEALKHLRSALERGKQLESEWQSKFDAYKRAFPELGRELERRFSETLPEKFGAEFTVFPADPKGIATRKASETVLQEIAKTLPEVIGGSADLDPSTFTWLKKQGDFERADLPLEAAQGLLGGEAKGYAGRNLHFGVREHAMGAAVNGLAYHDGFIPYTATFLVFSDYMRPPIRLAALAHLRSIFVFTHDSVGVGEDGPTHQPIEQLAALRAIPRLLVIRPCDANETRWAWQVAVEQTDRPTALIFTRQNVPTLDRSVFAAAENLRRGAYVLNPSVDKPELILIATGSEVHLILDAEAKLREKGLKVRLVSMPEWRLFEEQSDDYRESVLPKAITARLAVEAGSPLGWERWTGSSGAIIGLDRFGGSAPGPTIFKELGFTVEHVVERALQLTAGK
ncbi:MAG TPA: transketolase, partial [Polyangiales bacterium]|nr:transketolase [Polyangiales bacterium]